MKQFNLAKKIFFAAIFSIVMYSQNANAQSCLGNCGGFASTCACDVDCFYYGDCCADACVFCANTYGSYGFGYYCYPYNCSGCSNSNTLATTLTFPSCGSVSSYQMQNGTYVNFSVTSGATYLFHTCHSSWTFDTQITGYQGSNTTPKFTNNASSTTAYACCLNCTSYDCSTYVLHAGLKWTADFTGTLRVLINMYNCQGGSYSTYLYYGMVTPDLGTVLNPSTVWTGTVDNNWQNSGNWSNGVPTSTLNAYIPKCGPYQPTLYGDGVSYPAGNCRTITIYSSDGAVLTWNTSTAILNVHNQF